jgi:hypothetical protein
MKHWLSSVSASFDCTRWQPYHHQITRWMLVYYCNIVLFMLYPTRDVLKSSFYLVNIENNTEVCFGLLCRILRLFYPGLKQTQLYSTDTLVFYCKMGPYSGELVVVPWFADRIFRTLARTAPSTSREPGFLKCTRDHILLCLFCMWCGLSGWLVLLRIPVYRVRATCAWIVAQHFPSEFWLIIGLKCLYGMLFGALFARISIQLLCRGRWAGP